MSNATDRSKMKLIYGTGNQGKINQVKDYLKAINLDIEIISIKDLGFNEEIEENGKTFEENSLIKARAIKEFCNKNNINGIIITDDSGICVECLDDRPGIYSARYAGDHAPQEVVLNKLLTEMKEVEEKTGIKNRKAKFVCVMTAILPDGQEIVSRGEDNGTILQKVEKYGKLTYDPIFVPDGFDVPMIDIDDKDLGATHREKALLKLMKKLNGNIKLMPVINSVYQEEENKKVLLGMSGGVDSSVSALLLKERGYEVIGATLELFAGSSCCNINTYLDAKNVCNQIGVPHFTYNYKDDFKKYVIDDFINCYANCKTPNPCIECNKYMKFGAMYQKAKELGCKYIATGHYAKTEYSEKYGRWVLKKSRAGKKDQSYVLWNIPKELIEYVVFPLADFESKEEIRKIAAEHNLKVANKPDSEDICFIPDGNYKKFLENNSNIKPMEGNIVNSKGEVLGKHTGLYNYTIGQRKGLGISNSVPLFVLGFNKARNEVIVGEEKELYKKEILVTDINLLLVDKINDWMEVEVKTRYSSKVAKAKIKQEGDNIKVIFDEPQRAITPGQSAVFYVEDIVLGGGKIIDF